MYTDMPFWRSIVFMLFGVSWRHPTWPGAIRRKVACVWVVTFVADTLLMFYQETHG